MCARIQNCSLLLQLLLDFDLTRRHVWIILADDLLNERVHEVEWLADGHSATRVWILLEQWFELVPGDSPFFVVFQVYSPGSEYFLPCLICVLDWNIPISIIIVIISWLFTSLDLQGPTCCMGVTVENIFYVCSILWKLMVVVYFLNFHPHPPIWAWRCAWFLLSTRKRASWLVALYLHLSFIYSIVIPWLEFHIVQVLICILTEPSLVVSLLFFWLGWRWPRWGWRRWGWWRTFSHFLMMDRHWCCWLLGCRLSFVLWWWRWRCLLFLLGLLEHSKSDYIKCFPKPCAKELSLCLRLQKRVLSRSTIDRHCFINTFSILKLNLLLILVAHCTRIYCIFWLK